MSNATDERFTTPVYTIGEAARFLGVPARTFSNWGHGYKATFENPHQFSAGISHVIVNGRSVIDGGRHTGARSGIALKGPGFSTEMDHEK